jgi:DNA-binding CsgD family transcriptional regulator
MASYWVGCLVTLGRWSEAEVVSADLDDLLAHPAERDPVRYLETALIRQGRLDEVRQAMEWVRTLFGDPNFWLEGLCELGAILIEFDAADGGDVDPAAMVDDLLDRCRDRGSFGHWKLLGAAIAAQADRLGRTDGRGPNDATPSLILANRWIDDVDARVETVAAEDCVARDRAVAERSRLRCRPDATAWARVATGFEDLGMRYDEAHARWRWAEALLAGVAGRSSSARCAAAEVLRRAHALAADLPAPPLLGEIESLAGRARLNLSQMAAAPVIASPPTDALGLTRRERDVLELVACGLSNGAIGERLFISRKTASVHVSNILRKLCLDNRVEAAAVLHRHNAKPDVIAAGRTAF